MLNTKFNYNDVNTEKMILSEDGQIVSINLPDSNYFGLFISGTSRTQIDPVSNITFPMNYVCYFSIRSIPESNLEKAWNLLVDIFIKYKVPFVTMVKRGKKLHEIDENLRGREIAIYTNNQINIDLQKLLTEAITLLVKEQVLPGYRAVNLKEIKGSNYNAYESFNYINPPQNSDESRRNIASFFSMSLSIPSNMPSMVALNILMAKKLLLELTHKSHLAEITVVYRNSPEENEFEFRGDVIKATELIAGIDLNELSRQLVNTVKRSHPLESHSQ